MKIILAAITVISMFFSLAGAEKIFEQKDLLILDGKPRTVPYNEKFDFGEGQSFTVEFCYKQNEPNPAKNYSSPVVRRGFWVISAANNFGTPIFSAAGNVNGKWTTFYHMVALLKKSFGQWHHVAFVRDAKSKRLRFYHNGKMLKEVPEPEMQIFSAPGKPLVIGNGFKGEIRDVVIWNDVKEQFFFNQTPAAAAQPPVKIDQELQKSWAVLKKYKLNIVPAPKQIRITGKAFVFNPAEWSVKFADNSSLPGYQVFCERAGKVGNGKNIIAEKYNKSIKEQGYTINFEPGKITIEGADSDGLRYAWLTLAYLVNENKMIQPVFISDYPDFRGREAGGISPVGKAENLFSVIEFAFRLKLNSLEVNYLTNFELWLKWPVAEWKKINDYAVARGINIAPLMFPAVQYLGEDYKKLIPAGYSSYYYPYKQEEGLFGYGRGAYSWSRDDLAVKRAQAVGRFCAETNMQEITIHSIDHGDELTNPGNWGMRTEMDKKRWGDDYASAHAHLMNLYIKEIRKFSPDIRIWIICYPYWASSQPKTLKFYREFSAKLDKNNVMVPLREAPRELFCDTFKAFGDVVVKACYYPFIPWEYYPSYMNSGRYAATFFMDKKQNVAFYFGALLGNLNPSKAVAAEYSWNPFAPGAANMPENKYDYSVVYGDAPLVEAELLPRVAARFVGEKAGDAFAGIYAYKFTDKIPEQPYDLLPAETNHKAYFENLLKKVRKARKLYDGAKADVIPEGKAASNILGKFLVRMELLTQARLHCINARAALQNGDIASAEKEAQLGKEILKRPEARNRGVHRKIENDLAIADTIKLTLEKNKYLKSVSARKVRVGFYKYSGTSNIADFIGMLPDSLNNSAGMTCGQISNLTKKNLKTFDVLVFNAVSDIGDCDEPWRENLIEFVNKGGGIIFTHNAVGRNNGGLKNPLFPEICAGFAGIVPEKDLYRADGTMYEHRYADHCQLKAGAKGKILTTDRFKQPVTVTGDFGKGRVIYTGEIFGFIPGDKLAEPDFDEWQRFFKLVRWASGDDNLR